MSRPMCTAAMPRPHYKSKDYRAEDIHTRLQALPRPCRATGQLTCFSACPTWLKSMWPLERRRGGMDARRPRFKVRTSTAWMLRWRGAAAAALEFCSSCPSTSRHLSSPRQPFQPTRQYGKSPRNHRNGTVRPNHHAFIFISPKQKNMTHLQNASLDAFADSSILHWTNLPTMGFPDAFCGGGGVVTLTSRKR